MRTHQVGEAVEAEGTMVSERGPTTLEIDVRGTDVIVKLYLPRRGATMVYLTPDTARAVAQSLVEATTVDDDVEVARVESNAAHEVAVRVRRGQPELSLPGVRSGRHAAVMVEGRASDVSRSLQRAAARADGSDDALETPA